ncbi:hypothetical protein ACWIGM_09055 [Bosea sp. NPDC055332]
MENYAAQLFDAGARVESIIWIPGAVADQEGLPQAFEDFVDDDFPDEATDPLIKALPCLKRFVGEGSDPSEVAEALCRTNGFLVQAAAPCRRYVADNVFYSGWGSYYTAWLYAKDEGQITEVVVAWAEAKATADEADYKAKEAA